MAGKRTEVIRGGPLFTGHLPPAPSVIDAIGDLPPVHAGEESSDYDPSCPLNDYQRLMRDECDSLTLHRATRHSEKMLEIIRHAGANISALPPGMVTSGFSSCYSRLDANRPSTTLTVNFVHPASNRCIHPTQDRALTPREGARIQSFPDRFEFKGTSAQIVKQIGNAVPPLLGQVIADAIVASEARHLSAKPIVEKEKRTGVLAAHSITVSGLT
jgi:DNA (cytosine-5)-methyltransferase 1